jgi:2-oxoacid:acceptor oxidoreductase delta subunit (pyruvate/2-ketoisovalerate family)
VAIIGAGPSGLSCGYQLARRGYKVTVFDALPKPGGMMLAGIPEYRLPRRILDSEIEEIKNVGVEIELNTRVKSLDSLFKQGYNAIFLGLGAHQGLKLGVEGENLPGVIESVEFLRRANLGEKINVGERVGVIGGGNVAIDSARMSLRFGAKKVTIFYRRSRAEMPASPEEIEDAIKEGIEVIYLAAPSKVSRENNTLELECVRMELGEPDASGRPRPIPVKESEFITELDTLLAAIGQRPEVPAELGVEIEKGNLIKVNAEMKTSREGVFAGGDCVIGPASVIESIAAGNQAAVAIDNYLQGRPLAPVAKPAHVVDFKELNLNYLEQKTRLNWINDTESAMEEAKRCFSCGYCNLCGNCWLFCPDMAVKRVNEHYEIDYDYCKGCGICSHECPCSLISMVEEER